jgi:selenocysteine lyase/cysteine desulfurase
VTVHDLGLRRCAIVTFTVSGVDCGSVFRALGAVGVNVSVTSVGAAQLDLPRRGLTELVRASVHYYNTGEELARMVAALPPPTLAN